MTNDMDLRRLLPGLTPAPPAVDVVDVATHSGEVVPGGLFLACTGTRSHGLAFLPDALRRGASAVAWETGEGVQAPDLPAGVAGLPVAGLGRRLGDIANEFFAQPSAQLAVTGITGTNGKTTVAWLVVQALAHLGRRAGYLGTLGFGLGTAVVPDALTTPGCITVHRRLRELADRGAEAVAMEVSSHALDQGRVDGVAFRIAAFTNLSRDHLDYHGDLARYGEAKARLFLEHAVDSAVINVGDGFGRRLAARLPRTTRLVAVAAGSCPDAGIRVRTLSVTPGGQRLELEAAGQAVAFDSCLPGAFNAENVAVAAGILAAAGFGIRDSAAALAAATAPPGRMEPLGGAPGPQVIVDFAHTPDALRRVLEALRGQAAGRLWCVFGCGGERDAGKRAPMGAVARQLADEVIVTDDNPRREDAEAIVAAILEGAGRGPGVTVIRDREAAIRHAILAARPGDIVLIAGKGHESVQVIGTEARPFSDREAARRALAQRP
ncbi:MAG: UDP-N-acetylmuramoyl-L-alanyl-D-glutamate--2,6-diaminopimelate ligase [Gammaproteobacteria bacterium]|nr:UDP-N-acetylmuramoyl-L-alanyl-D-glutamate--2,6-diaminopimelate ligase [Gammaproteobacteria bacterium]